MKAANNIEANTKKLMEVLFKKKYQVKYFQREYKWKKHNIEDLLTDLERSFINNYSVEHTRDNVPEYDCYYMGPIVLYREKTAFIIVDGQQRLTSFTLLLVYLIHLQKIVFKDNQKKIQNLKEYIFSQPYENETFNLEIPEREPILKCLYENCDILDSMLENESSINIFDRYNDIVDLFPPRLKHESVLPLFINWLLEKLVFIEIMAQTSDSAYTIFESMNDRGLRLTQSELLKSYLLSNVQDEVKIKELDIPWKKKIAQFQTYKVGEDEEFFKAWLRAKYAETIRSPEKGEKNQDFEKIGTRFSNWVQDSSERLLNLEVSNPDSFFLFVHSDFHFYSDLYLRLAEFETSEDLPEHTFQLISYKGISASLSYPFILSPIKKVDEEETIIQKIYLTVSFLDCFAIYRTLLNQPITQSSVDYAINHRIKEIRNLETDALKTTLKEEIDVYKNKFIKEIDYIPFNSSSKYILSRIFKNKFPDNYFHDIYFQRKKDSFLLIQFFSHNDVGKEFNSIPNGLRDIFIDSLCTYCIVPKYMAAEIMEMPLLKRIPFLVKKNYLWDIEKDIEFDPANLKSFLMALNKRLKTIIFNTWKI